MTKRTPELPRLHPSDLLALMAAILYAGTDRDTSDGYRADQAVIVAGDILAAADECADMRQETAE